MKRPDFTNISAPKEIALLVYPGTTASESEIVFFIATAIKSHNLDCRLEVSSRGGKKAARQLGLNAPLKPSENRLDIVIFNEDKTVRRIIEVKKYRLTSRRTVKGGKQKRANTPSKVKNQLKRYLQFGPVDLVCGMKAARKYVENTEFLSESQGIRQFG